MEGGREEGAGRVLLLVLVERLISLRFCGWGRGGRDDGRGCKAAFGFPQAADGRRVDQVE